jgi:hypothetical protein
MRFDVPIEVQYLTEGAVPIEDVIDALISAKLFIEEGGYNLTGLVPGLNVEQVQVHVRSVSQESPLREALFAAIYLTLQKDLEREVPALIELTTGTAVPENFKTIVTLSILIALFYGAAYVKDLVVLATINSKLKRQLNALIEDMAHRTGRSEDFIRKFLDDRYKPHGRIKVLAQAAFQFFKPSKAQSNAPIKLNNREISQEVISDVPEHYSYEEVLDAKTARNFSGVELELHAQDRDRDASGWAAVPKGITDKRLRMKLMDGVTPYELWGRNSVRGDVIVTYKRVGTEMVPSEIHLTRVHP